MRLRSFSHAFAESSLGFAFPVPTTPGVLFMSYSLRKTERGLLRAARVFLDVPSRVAGGGIIAGAGSLPSVRVGLSDSENSEDPRTWDLFLLTTTAGGGFSAGATWVSQGATDGTGTITGGLILGGDRASRAGADGRIQAAAQRTIRGPGMSIGPGVREFDTLFVQFAQAANAPDAGPAGPVRAVVTLWVECDDEGPCS